MTEHDDQPDDQHTAAASGKKGRPTPKRKDREAANKRGLVLDVKADAKERRAKMREEREREYVALRTGDERNMPPNHRGPERRFIRDFIDARTSMGEFLLPVSIGAFIMSFFLAEIEAIAGLVQLVFLAIVAASIIETIVMVRRLKRYFIAKFGAEKFPYAWHFYAITRQLTYRRFRSPRPKVNRGEYPI